MQSRSVGALCNMAIALLSTQMKLLNYEFWINPIRTSVFLVSHGPGRGDNTSKKSSEKSLLNFEIIFEVFLL